ncbi:MAG: ABC transporter ATP-binding protein [Verrucomicrobiota bacterium]
MIEIEKLKFSYNGSSRFELSIEQLSIRDGERVALVGPSGCGKTTLLQLIGGVFVPESGAIRFRGEAISALDEKARSQYRLREIGQVPQTFELLDYLTVAENIELPYWLSSGTESGIGSRSRVQERCRELAERTGISELLNQRPRQLSQGERQRTALCRGLVMEPKLMLADEPTGNLDPENQDRVVDLLLAEAARIDATVIMITHEPALIPRFDRSVEVSAFARIRRDSGGKEVAE